MNKINGLLRHNPSNPRYFADSTGKAVYLTGSHTWAVQQDMWDAKKGGRINTDYGAFLGLLADKGHNFLRFWQFSLVTRGIPVADADVCCDPMPYIRADKNHGLANDGLPKFDLDCFNEEYFLRLRERVAAAGERGIYVSVMMFESWSVKYSQNHPEYWKNHVYNSINNINGITDDPMYPDGRAIGICTLGCPQIYGYQKKFVKKVVDTLNDFDNVLYEISNEVPFMPEAYDWQNALCAYIREYEASLPKQHMIGITSEGGGDDNQLLFDSCADWISPTNGRLFEYRYDPPAADGTKVIINDTDHLWGHGCETGWAWKSFTRGMNVLFMDPWQPFPGESPWWIIDGVSMNTRYFYAWEPMRQTLGYIKSVADRFDLNKMRPDSGITTTRYCLADPEGQYIVYNPEGTPFGMDLSAASGTYSVEWFDVVTGMTYAAGEISLPQRMLFNPPGMNSKVLMLTTGARRKNP